VRGDDFFERPVEVNKLWKAIEGGSHILLAAPRRVGKTSLLHYLLDNPRPGYHFLYVITQSVYSEDDFYKRLFEALFVSDNTKSWMRITEKAKERFREFFNRIQKIDVPGYVNLEFRETDSVKYFARFTTLLSALETFNEKLVIMVDEFPEVVENIISRESDAAAIEFLKRKREIRQNVAWSKNVLFIYTGSIGLANVVSRLKEMDTINDLKDATLLPLSVEDADRFIRELLKEQRFNLESEQIDYLLKKLEWLLPFYLQLFIEELSQSYDLRERPMTNGDIEAAFNKISNQNNVFKHWEERLRTAFKGNTLAFVIDVLNGIARRGTLQDTDLQDLSVKYGCVDQRNEVVDSLIHDGYIHVSAAHPKHYRFNSPLLKAWWLYHVAD
jgi:AAA+ ATPase superfamily predicted ATPase